MAGQPGRDRVIKIPCTRVVRGNRFFEPTKAMRRAGFRPIALGSDNESARRRALGLYEKWTSARRAGAASILETAKLSKEQICAARVYPEGSIGEAWQKWIRSTEWARMAPSTRNKIWWEAWTKRIEPIFGDLRPDDVTMDDLSRWRASILAASGPDAAHKALKVWRAFWRRLKPMRYTFLSDPSDTIRNTAPLSRTQRFSHGETMRLAKTAWRSGFRGLSCIILTAWDTGFSPVDCRTLRARHRVNDSLTGRIVFDRSMEGRGKTGVPVIGTLSRFGDWMIRRYLDELGADMTDEAFLFRMRTGVPYQESRLGGDFARIREIAMLGDKRQLRDMRRSAVLEAFTGGADAGDVSQKFGNTIGHSNALYRTYNPVDIDQVRNADVKRLAGRRIRNKG